MRADACSMHSVPRTWKSSWRGVAAARGARLQAATCCKGVKHLRTKKWFSEVHQKFAVIITLYPGLLKRGGVRLRPRRPPDPKPRFLSGDSGLQKLATPKRPNPCLASKTDKESKHTEYPILEFEPKFGVHSVKSTLHSSQLHTPSKPILLH